MKNIFIFMVVNILLVCNTNAVELNKKYFSEIEIKNDELVVGKDESITISKDGVLKIGSERAANSSLLTQERNIAATQSPQYSVQGYRRVYDRPAYSAKDNLVVNSSFVAGGSGWKFTHLVDNRGTPLYSIVKYDGKSWLRINQDIQTYNGAQGLLEQTIEIPVHLQNEVIEISFLVSGLFTGFRVAGDSPDFVFNVKISPAHPERIYYYYHPKGASSFTLSFMKGYPGQRVANEHFDITEVAVRKAAWTSQKINQGLPASGGTVQLARWFTAWDEKSQHRQLENIRKMGGMVRVWLSAELLGDYIIKNNPTKRSSQKLSPQYSQATTAKVFNGISPARLKQLDWFFNSAKDHGLKVIVTLLGGFTDGAGNPHASLSRPQSLEFIDTDVDVRAGFNVLISKIVSRYAVHRNIVAWELVNEGWATWNGSYAGYAASAPFSTERSLSFAGYRDWERSAYKAIKTVDSNRPVLLNSGGSDTHYLLHSDSVCDWSGVSLYLGSIRISHFSGTPSRFRVFSGKTNSLANGTPLRAYSTGVLPSGLSGTKTYYVVNVTPVDFEVAETPGGLGIDVKGGTGVLSFYSTDGTSLAAFDNIFQRWADFPKPTVLAEMGAPADVDFLYRDDKFQSPYLREGFKRLKKYGFISGIVFDEFPGRTILWDQDYNLNSAGKVVEQFGRSGKVD